MAEIQMNKNTAWELPITINSNGTRTEVIETEDTYVDRNIKVTITTPDAEFEVKQAESVTATAGTTDTTYTSSTVTNYPITITADATAGAVKVGTKTAGFTADTDVVEVEAATATQATKTIYVKEGSLQKVTGDVAITSDGKVDLGSKLTAAPSSGYYIKATSDGSVGVATSGWVDTTKTAAVDTDAEAYYTIASATLDNAETTGQTYTTGSAPILVSGKGLYINEGYIENTYIPLATLVPDEATVKAGTDGNSNLIYKTVSVYDKDGTLIAGTMGDAELGDITASNVESDITSVTVAANDDNSAFKVTASGNITGDSSVAISKTGYATTSLSKTGSITGTAEVDATLAKIGLKVETSGNDGVVTPVIAKEDSTTAKSGSITKTAPTTGYFVAVSTAAIKEDVTISPEVATEGYGTTSVYSATNSTLTAGADASGTYYVPITSGSHTITENASSVTKAQASVATNIACGDDTIDISGITTTQPSGTYITIDTTTTPTSGSVQTSSTCTVTEGYVAADSKTTTISETVEVTKTEAATKYIKVFTGLVLES